MVDWAIGGLYTSAKVLIAIGVIFGAMAGTFKVARAFFKIAENVAHIPQMVIDNGALKDDIAALKSDIGDLSTRTEKIERRVGKNGGSTLFELGAELKDAIQKAS